MEVIIGLLLLLLLGGGVSPSRISRAVERSIRNALPSANDVDVQIKAASRKKLLAGQLDEVIIGIDGFDIEDLAKLRVTLSSGRPAREGYVGRLVIEGRNGRLERSGTGGRDGRFQVARVRLEFDDVSFDMRDIMGAQPRLTVHGIGRARGFVALSEAALNASLRGRIRTLRDPSITFQEPNHVRLRGVLDAAVPVSVEVGGTLAIRHRTEVVLAAPRINVMGVALPDSVVHRLAEAANPLVDLRQWKGLPGHIRLWRVSVRGSTVVAEGEVRLRRRRIRALRSFRETVQDHSSSSFDIIQQGG